MYKKSYETIKKSISLLEKYKTVIAKCHDLLKKGLLYVKIE